MSKFSLKGKVAVVSGGGNGIGKAISLNFAGQGAYVHLLEINREVGEQTAREIRDQGLEAEFHHCNISDQAAVLNIFERIEEQHPVNILVNNAGVAAIGKAHETSEADFTRVFDVNVRGVYNCIFACIPYFLKNGGGVILNMASVVSTVGIPDRFAYSMSKGAVLTMTLSVAKDYISRNIRCNSISPARVHTPFVDGYLREHYPGREKEMYDKLAATQPIGRMATPQEIADLALFLCSDEAGFITGSDYAIDGGFIKLNN